MPNINLLPWREELRKEQEKQFYVFLGMVVALSLAVWGLIHYHYVQKIDYQESRNQLIQEQITIVDKQIAEIKDLDAKKTRLLAQINAIQRLQGDRPLIVRLFDELVLSVPDGVHFDSVVQKGNTIKINGAAESNARVSSMMRNIERSEWVTKPQLTIIEGKEGQKNEAAKLNLFELSFVQQGSVKSDDATEEEEE